MQMDKKQNRTERAELASVENFAPAVEPTSFACNLFSFKVHLKYSFLFIFFRLVKAKKIRDEIQ